MFIKNSSLIFFLLYSFASAAQQTTDSSSAHSTEIILDTIDTRPRNMYGDLLRDDPRYNRRYSAALVLARVTTSNIFVWSYNRYVLNKAWVRISSQSIKNNFKYGWEWDNDRFGTNFISHPQSGSNYFNVARSNGYSFWASYPFAIFCSAQW